MQTQRQPGRAPARPAEPPVLVVGAGVGGLAAAVVLAAQGRAVQVVERDSLPGGKLRPLRLAGRWLDAGPTVLTMRPVFDALFALAGERLDDSLCLTPLRTLARHAWDGGAVLDLHADRAASVDAIGMFAGTRAAADYEAFCRRTQRLFAALDAPYLRATRPNPVQLAWRCGLEGLGGLAGLWGGAPMRTLWQVLQAQFADPRLRQLFGRYATYAGSSPLAAPATLMLIAHVEQCGVWTAPGGLHALGAALAALAQRLGVALHMGRGVQRLLLRDGAVRGVQLDDGERLAASAVVFNGDAAALSAGLLGPEAQRALRPPAWAAAGAPAQRSLSALTWNLVAPTQGFPLLRHNVFFPADSAAEFQDLFGAGRLPAEPTVYVCAQDRGDDAWPSADATHRPERLLCLVNAPACADGRRPLTDEEIDACERRSFTRLARMGLQIGSPQSLPSGADPNCRRHDPAYWAQRFPATGGALYGQATHGWRSAFSRPTAQTRLPGLFLAGGSTHPGAGVPMAALSGWLAAEACLGQRTTGRASTRPWPRAATPGGTSTR